MYPALYVAEYIIYYCYKNEIPLSNLKLQKLLYFVQAEFLVNEGGPCFPEEIEAWQFGPVVPEVYYKYRVYGSSDIPPVRSNFSGMKDADREAIDRILDVCARYSAGRLVEITHHQDPWMDAYSPYMHKVISQDSIRNFFSN